MKLVHQRFREGCEMTLLTQLTLLTMLTGVAGKEFWDYARTIR